MIFFLIHCQLLSIASMCATIHLHLLTFTYIWSFDYHPIYNPYNWKICRSHADRHTLKKITPSLNQSRPAPQTRTVYAADPTPVTGEVDVSFDPLRLLDFQFFHTHGRKPIGRQVYWHAHFFHRKKKDCKCALSETNSKKSPENGCLELEC